MQKTMEHTPQIIPKEEIPNLEFKLPVTVEQPDDLMERLIEATKLGNLHHVKIAIVFHDDEGLKQVETTIWATGAKYICLKGGVWLPISRIKDIKLI